MLQKNGLLHLEISAVKLEKVPESAIILEKGLLESCRGKTHHRIIPGKVILVIFCIDMPK